MLKWQLEQLLFSIAESYQNLKQAAHLVPEDQGHHSTCQLDQQADTKDVHELQENKCKWVIRQNNSNYSFN